MVVFDTCAMIEAFRKTPVFSDKALERMESGFYILSISIAEIACKLKLGKLQMNASPSDVCAYYRQIEHAKIIDIGIDEWLDAIELDWKHRDPVDRMITAFGVKKQLPIVTSDKEIKSFYKNVIW